MKRNKDLACLQNHGNVKFNFSIVKFYLGSVRRLNGLVTDNENNEDV